MTAAPPFAAHLLVLGRVSNLPTVWSNCLAAWLLAGGAPDARLLALCAGGSLFYTGGMFLNDAFDAKFDTLHRPERPIPSGHVPRARAFALGAAQLLGGAGLFLAAGAAPSLTAALAGLIVLYDATHKFVAASPLVMAACRSALVLGAATAATEQISPALLGYGAALFLYVAGTGFLARDESSDKRPPLWPFLFILATTPILLTLPFPFHVATAITLAAFLLWSLHAFRFTLGTRPSAGAAVGRLLAGMILLDAWAVAGASSPMLTGLFFALFLLARLAQWSIPAT